MGLKNIWMITPVAIASLKNIFAGFILVTLFFLPINFSYAQDENKLTDNASEAFNVLGRELTKKEISSLGSGAKITRDLVRDQFLHRETSLVAVRVLGSLGVEPTKRILAELYFEELKPYDELKKYCTDLIKQYGSLEKGLERRHFSDDKDTIFTHAVDSAYKEVHGRSPGEVFTSDQISDVYRFLKSKNATHYDEILKVFQSELDKNPEEKLRIYKKLLKEIGREDLINKENFKEAILKQSFTHDNLKTLFRQLR